VHVRARFLKFATPPPEHEFFSNEYEALKILTFFGPCTLSVVNGSPHVLPPMARDSLGLREPLNGSYILVTNRTQSWMGPAQTITNKLKLHLTYQVSAWVRVSSVTNGPQTINVL